MKKEFRKKVIADRKAKDKDFIEKNSDIITEKYASHILLILFYIFNCSI